MIVLSPHNPSANPRTLHYLITHGLGYCCPWFFFQLFRSTITVAERLGVTTRAVRALKSRVDNHECTCEGNPRCMKHLLRPSPGKRSGTALIINSRDLD